jgi:sec-independent protein translocase protein TatA
MVHAGALWVLSKVTEQSMDLFSPKHLLMIVIIVLLVFGTKKLRSLGSDLGSAVRGFKKAMNDGESEEQARQIEGPAGKDAEFPEVAAKAPAKAAAAAESKSAAPHA